MNSCERENCERKILEDWNKLVKELERDKTNIVEPSKELSSPSKATKEK